MKKAKSAVRQVGKATKNVLLLLDIEIGPGRQRLVGIFRNMRQAALNWNIKLISSSSPVPSSSTAADGIIAVEDSSTRAILQNRIGHTPVIALDAMESIFLGDTANIVRINVDDEAIGRMAGEHLVSRGRLRALAYVPDPQNNHWSDIRCLSLEQEAQKRRIAFHRFDNADDRLSDWLRTLPLPSGILAANHRRAVDVIEASHAAGLNIPQQLIVVGVDNEEIFCDYAKPTISCVDLDFEKEGFMAATELDALMKAKRPRPMKSLLLPPLRIIERESTATVVPASLIVERALAFIRENAASGIKVEDVVKEMRVSRRLADLRFGQLQGETINDCIRRHQLERVTRLLTSTELPIKDISKRCGFRSDKYLKRLFLQKFGMTMRTYRKNRKG